MTKTRSIRFSRKRRRGGRKTVKRRGGRRRSSKKRRGGKRRSRVKRRGGRPRTRKGGNTDVAACQAKCEAQCTTTTTQKLQAWCGGSNRKGCKTASCDECCPCGGESCYNFKGIYEKEIKKGTLSDKAEAKARAAYQKPSYCA